MIEYRDTYRLQNGLSSDDRQRKDKNRQPLNAPHTQTYGPPISSVPRSTGPGPPPQYPSSTSVFSGGTVPTQPGAPSESSGPRLSIKRSPKVKIFQKKERISEMLGSRGRENVLQSGLQRVTVESNKPQVVYETSPALPAVHRHLPNVSAHRPASSVTKKSAKQPSPSPIQTPTILKAPSSSSTTVFRGGMNVFYPQSEAKSILKVVTKGKPTPLPAHSRPATPSQAGLVSLVKQPVVLNVENQASEPKDVPLDLSCDTYIPNATSTVMHKKEVPVTRVSESTTSVDFDCPLDLSVKKRPHSSDSGSASQEPAVKKKAVESVPLKLSGKVTYSRAVTQASATISHRQGSAGSHVGIAFGNPRVAPVGIATATSHSQDRQVELDVPTPRPAHLNPPPSGGLNTPPIPDFTIISDGRPTKDMLVVGRRSPILPGGQSTVTPSLRHTDVVNVRGKPFKVSTVRPQVNGRPVITTRTFPSATTTTPTNIQSTAASTSTFTLNGTIGSGPLACLQLSNITVSNAPVRADTPGKLCDLNTLKPSEDQPQVFMIGQAGAPFGLSMVNRKQNLPSSDARQSAGAESSEENESACQAPLLNIPKYKPSKVETKSKKTVKPPLIINIPDHISTSSSPRHSSSPAVVQSEDESQARDTQCVSISTQTVDASEDDHDTCEKEEESDDSDENDGIIVVDDFPPPDEPVDLKELYPTPSRTLMCARKSTTKQNKRLLQQILESRSPPKLSVINHNLKKAPSPPPPKMPILSPHRSPPILVPQTLPKEKAETPTSLEMRKSEAYSVAEGQDSDCDHVEVVRNKPAKGKGPASAMSTHKNESGDKSLHSKKSNSRKSSQKAQAFQSSLKEDLSSSSSSRSTDAEVSATVKSSISSMHSNSSNSVSSITSHTPASNCLLAKILVAEGERQKTGRNSPQICKSPSNKSELTAGSSPSSNIDSDSENTKLQRPPSVPSHPSVSQSGANIFEKFQALADEARSNCEEADTNDELSLMCWEQMAASPPSEKLTSPTEEKKPSKEQRTEHSEPGEKDKVNEDALSESSNDSTNSVIARTLSKVSNVSAFMPTTKTKLTPLHYASIKDSQSNANKRSGSPVPIESTRFYQANFARGSLNRSTSSPALDTVSTSKPGTPQRVSRSMTSTPQPSPVYLTEDLEDWQLAHINYQTTKLRRPPVLVTIPRSASKGTVMKRLSPDGLYDYCPSAQYGKAKACMTGDSHTPVFTPIRSLSTTSVHGLTRLATMDFSSHHPRSARTVAEYNRARSASCGSRSVDLPTTVVTGTDLTETWTMVKEVSPRKPGSPAAARHKESSGTLVTVLRRERSKEESGSSSSSKSPRYSKSPIPFSHERSSSLEQPIPLIRPGLHRSESAPSRCLSPSSTCSAEGDWPKITLIYGGDGKVKIGHSKKKSSKSSKPEKHRRCSYTIKGDPLEIPSVVSDPTSPQPKLSPIRLVASPPRKKKSSKKSEIKSPPGSPRLSQVSSPVHMESCASLENTTTNKTLEESSERLKLVVPKKPKYKPSVVTNESSQNPEIQEPPLRTDSQSPPIASLKIRVDQPTNPVKRVLSPLRINIKSPHHVPEPLSDSDIDTPKDKNILYDLPTSPEPEEEHVPPLVAESNPAPEVEVPVKKKEKKSSKKHKKEKRRESSKEKSKSSESRKEKKEKKNREKEKDKEIPDSHKKEISDSNHEEKSKKKSGNDQPKEKAEKRTEVPETGKEERKEESKKKESKDTPSKKKEAKEHRKEKSEAGQDEPARERPSKKLKSSHKKKDEEKKKSKSENKTEKDNNESHKKKEKSDGDRSGKQKSGKKKKSGSKRSKKLLKEPIVENEEPSKKPKRRSLLAELANSEGYVAEKTLDQKKSRDLYADPAKLGREERALLRAMMRFTEMEQSGTDSADHLSVTSDKVLSKRSEQTSARRKAQALTKNALKRARNKGGCSKKPKFDDFVPEILPSRTRTQAAELANRKNKDDVSAKSDSEETKDGKKCSSGPATPDKKSAEKGSAKKRAAESTVVKKLEKEESQDDGRWQILSDEEQEKPVVPTKKKGGLSDHGLTMKIQWKSSLWEKYVQNQRRRGRPSKALKPLELWPQRRKAKHTKSSWTDQAVKEEPAQAAEYVTEGHSKEDEMDVATPLLEDVKVKQEPFETDLLTPLLRPDPVAAPSPAPSTSTGLSVGGTEEYWPVPECVKKMSVNQNTGETILHKAARLGYEDVARFCAQTDYLELDARDHAGYTAMHECCSQGHLKVTELLIEGGASVNLASCDGMRPLHDAVENDLMEMVRLLLSRGADPKLATYAGKTVLGLTKEKEMLSFLTGYFQDLNGCRQPQPEIPWTFEGSGACEDPEEESGFEVLEGPPEAEPGDVNEISFEFSEGPPIQTYFLPLDPVKGSVNYVTLDDVAERLGLTAEVFLKEYTSLPIQTCTVDTVLMHCQCLGTDVVARLRALGSSGSLKLLEYSDVIRHLLDISPQRLSTLEPDSEMLVPGILPWDEIIRRQNDAAVASDKAVEHSGQELLSYPSDMDCFDWNEQVEQFSARLGESNKNNESCVAEQEPTVTSTDIYRGLFLCGTSEEDEEGVDGLYLAAMGLDESAPKSDKSDNEKKVDEDIFFRKPY